MGAQGTPGDAGDPGPMVRNKARFIVSFYLNGNYSYCVKL